GQPSPFAILKNIPSGFTYIRTPPLTDLELLRYTSVYLPGVVIILVLEGSFFGMYPKTGLFVCIAIKSKSGVHTPLSGIFSGILVILAIFVLTLAFYYIPEATLA
ncbi:653_t:CDS:2, partial [Entrophospora sp. SA101]